MLNKKALAAATLAICAALNEEPEGKRVFQNLDGEVVTETFFDRNHGAAKAAIETYHADLPDEGELMEVARAARTTIAGKWALVCLIERLADALEAARVRLADCYDHSNEISQELEDSRRRTGDQR